MNLNGFRPNSIVDFYVGNPNHIPSYMQKNLGDNMKRVIIVLLLLVGFIFAQHKQVIVKKHKMSDTESVKDVDVNVDGEELTIKVIIDGEEKVFNANPENEDEMKALQEMLTELDVDVNVLHMDGDHPRMKYICKTGGYLGVHIEDLSDQLRNYFKVKGDGGVLVSEVVDESPAKASGLLAGDIIVKVNDKWISNTGELQETIRSFEPKEKVTITTVRKGREKSFSVVLGESEAPQFASHQFGKQNFMCDIPGIPKPGEHMKWFMFDGDEMDEEHGFLMEHKDDLKKQMEMLKKEMDELRKEFELMRSK